MNVYYLQDESSATPRFVVHKFGCKKYPFSISEKFLGLFISEDEAMSEAKLKYQNVCACPDCFTENNE